MPDQARGIQTTVALYDESTYTTPGAAGKKIYVVSSGVKAAQALKESNTLSSLRVRRRPALGNIDVAGPLQVEANGENIGFLLKHALGQVATTGSGPYSHVITVGSLPVGFTLEHDYGSAISGVGRYEQFNGCRVGGWTLSCPQEGFPTMSFDIKGAKSTLAASPLDASLDDTGFTPFSMFEATLLEGGSALGVATQLEIKGDNGLDDSKFAIGGAGVRRRLPEQFCTISGSVTVMFEDMTLLNKAINNTASSLKITLTKGDGLGSAGNESLEFFVQNLVYERNSPTIEGPGGLMIQLGFKDFLVGTDTFKTTLKNAVAAL